MWEQYLQNLAKKDLLRELSIIESAPNPLTTVKGKTTLQFASNDYLGLATHPKLKHAAQQAIDKFGVGSGASRLISGTLPPHRSLEGTLAQFAQTEDALIFSSGYATNLGVIPALAKADGIIFADRLCHASLIDACRLSRATLRVFRHNDVNHLHSLLKTRAVARPALIVTEGVFSMDGDLAPLPELVALAEEYEASLLVDDAHGTGVMGPRGGGTLEHYGIRAPTVVHMGTLSKAVGASGGFITGTHKFIQYLINIARPFMYSTSPPPATAAAAEMGIRIIQQEPQRRTKLWRNREHLYNSLQTLGFVTTNTQSPIIPIIVKEPGLALDLSHRLQEQSIYIPAIRPPTVPRGTSRLRLTVTSEHSIPQINQLLAKLQKIGQSLDII